MRTNEVGLTLSILACATPIKRCYEKEVGNWMDRLYKNQKETKMTWTAGGMKDKKELCLPEHLALDQNE